MKPICENVNVQLTGQSGNAFYVLGKVMSEMKKAGVEQAIIDQFKTEATSGNYDHLLVTCMKYVNVE